jgi:hypothetical protein
MKTDFDFRRTMTALTFCGSGVALSGLLAYAIHLVRADAPSVYRLAVGLEMLLAIVLLGLAMTVALRQVSGHFMGADFSASGGGDDDGPRTRTTVTADVTVTP